LYIVQSLNNKLYTKIIKEQDPAFQNQDYDEAIKQQDDVLEITYMVTN